jgi:hypothetical protein
MLRQPNEGPLLKACTAPLRQAGRFAKRKCQIGACSSGAGSWSRSGSSRCFPVPELKSQHSLSDNPAIDGVMTVSGPAPYRPAAARRAPLRRLAALLSAVGAVPMLTGCLLTADRLNPALDMPTSYRAPHGTAKTALPSAEWWRGFRSGELTGLIEQGLATNYDIAAAVARIAQADARARVTGAALLPIVDATGNVSRSRNGGGSAVTQSSVHTVALNASYVVDFWGRNRDLLRSAEFAASASHFDRELIALTTMLAHRQAGLETLVLKRSENSGE